MTRNLNDSPFGRSVTLLAIAAAGAALTSYGQTYLPSPFTQLANSYTVWLLSSFFFGWLVRSDRWALVGGAVLQLVMIVGYYEISLLRFGLGYGSLASNVIWLVGGVLVGPAAALAGRWVATQHRHAGYAAGLMSGIALSEALYDGVILRYGGEAAVFTGLALVLITWLGRRTRAWRQLAIAAAVVGLSGFGAFSLLAYVLSGGV